jgi:hypothetical protein
MQNSRWVLFLHLLLDAKVIQKSRQAKILYSTSSITNPNASMLQFLQAVMIHNSSGAG